MAARVTPGYTWAISVELVRGQAGFATELLAEDDPSLSGEAGIAATSPEEVQQLPWIRWESPQPPASPALPFSLFFLPVHECKYNTV